MNQASADGRALASTSRIIAFISDGRRAALGQLLADNMWLRDAAVHFATTPADVERAVTGGSLVLIDGTRLAELAAARRVRESAVAARGELLPVQAGAAVEQALARLPVRTRLALEDAFGRPRSWSVKRLAHAAGISTRQLVRQLRNAGFAVSPKDLLLAARLAAAQLLLRGPRVLTTRELAHACGWVDVRSLRSALRRAGFDSVALLRSASGSSTVSDIAARLSAPNDTQ